VEGRAWENPKARAEVVEAIGVRGLFTSEPEAFGDLGRPAEWIDPQHVQFAVVEGPYSLAPYLPSDDELGGALGRFSFRVGIEATVTPAGNNQWEIEVTRVGVYLHDTFDFSGDQPLGPPGQEYLSNTDYREYRRQTGRGADFEVFSDVRIVSPDDYSFRFSVTRVGGAFVYEGMAPESEPVRPGRPPELGRPR